MNALKGKDFLVITLGVRAPGDLHKRITIAAGKAGVRYIMPNAYGYPSLSVTGGGSMMRERIEDVQDGPSCWLTLPCGFWYEWSLALGNQWFGITIKDRKVTFFDDGHRKVTVSTWNQCGRALAALLSLPESDDSPSIADFVNRENPIFSFQVSQRDMLNSLHRVLGTTDSDWQIEYETVEQRIKDGQDELSRGIFTGLGKVMYGEIFASSNSVSNFASSDWTANEVLRLPREDLDEATKRTVAMVDSGWNPLAEIK